jgi:Ca2+-transporting ATPase
VDDAFRQRYMDENARPREPGAARDGDGPEGLRPGGFDPAADLLRCSTGLTVLALVGIVDPPRPTAKPLIAIAHEAGIAVRMITGDHAVTAGGNRRGARHPGKAITGAEFKAMSDDELDGAIDEIGVIARSRRRTRCGSSSR